MSGDQARQGSDLGSADPLQSIYGVGELSFFGPQYGITAAFFHKEHSSGEDLPQIEKITPMQTDILNLYEDMIQNGDTNLQRAYATSLKSPESRSTGTGSNSLREGSPRISAPNSVSASKSETAGAAATGTVAKIRQEIPATGQASIISGNRPSSCMICIEDFSETVRTPSWISLACLHEPSVCCDCIAKSIKIDLKSKIWNQIKCPECKTLLIHEDIQRLADAETFARYEVLSFRSAVNADENFIWCQSCDFGQLHSSGSSQPIVRCLKCGFRTCFHHKAPWHDRLTCEEYDEMLQDPDGFQSAIDKDDAKAAEAKRLQDEADEKLARELDGQNRLAEEDRQRRRHEEERNAARARQEAEAAKKKAEQQRQNQGEEMKRRKEESLSLDKVRATTKQCPGCRWPIEKNAGCSHMTCSQCQHQFCWNCMAQWLGHGLQCKKY